MSTVQSLLATSRFLTRIPMPGDASADLQRIHATWFPWVGFVVGGLMATTDLALASVDWSIRNALIVAVGLMATGAIHLDALMDSIDGLAAAGSASRDTMRSSVHTAEGAAAGVIAICLAWLALTQLGEPTRTRWLVCAPVLGRVAIVLGYRFFPASPDVGLVTRSLAQSARGFAAAASMAMAVVACFALIGLYASIVVLVAAVIGIGAAKLFQSYADGLGGDHYGALGVVAETSILAGAAIAGHLI